LRLHTFTVFCMLTYLLPTLFSALLLVTQVEPRSQPTIVDAATGAAIPYASLGVKNRAIGTVADGNGRFSAEPLHAAAVSDTVVVSCIGFQSRKVTLSELNTLTEVKLLPQPQALNEVLVNSKGWKRHHLGRDGSWGITFYNFHLASDKTSASKLGREVGTILHIKPGSIVEDANFYMGRNHFTGVKFRLNVRALDANDHPAEALLTRDVVFDVADDASGWQRINLKPYDVNVGAHSRVAVTLEWVAGTQTNSEEWASLLVPAAMSATHRMVFRDKSEDQWKVQPINLSLYVTALSPG
jgi:hypothetical protein